TRYIALLVCAGTYAEDSGFKNLPAATQNMKDFASFLRGYGYQIHPCYKATKEKMNLIMESVLQDLEAGVETVLLVCFSGHGLSKNGKQYVACEDSIQSEEESLVHLEKWIEDLQKLTSSRGRGRSTIAERIGAEIVADCRTILILDCCRTFLFEEPVHPARGNSSVAVCGAFQGHDAEEQLAIVYGCDEGRWGLGPAGEPSYLMSALMEVGKDGEGVELSALVQRLSARVSTLSKSFQRVDIHYMGFDEVAGSVVPFPTSKGISTLEQVEHSHRRAKCFFIVTHLLNDTAMILWLCGLIRKEWSTRALLVPHVIATLWAFFTANPDSSHSCNQSWFWIERVQYRAYFPAYFMLRALGEALRDNDFDRSLKTGILTIMTFVSTFCLHGLLGLWRESARKVDGLHCFGVQVWNATGWMTMPCLLICFLHLSGGVESVTASHLEMIHHMMMMMMGTVVSVHLTICFELAMQPFIWAREHLSQFCSYDNFYLLSSLSAFVAALVYADRSGVVLSSLGQTLWMAKYFLFFCDPAILYLAASGSGWFSATRTMTRVPAESQRIQLEAALKF
ncbi:unnamed protein product, partial [Cladocopium goreaui]